MRMTRFTCVVAAAACLGGAAPALAQQTAVSERPAFTPYTKAPELRSVTETAAALKAMYPSQLREAGIGGTAIVWLFIERTGEVAKTELFRSSGFDALDAAALRVAEDMEFTPALNRDRAVDVWVQVPVKFTAGERNGADRGRARAPDDFTVAPTFTPYTERPELSNQAVVAAALQAMYPPLLRDAGIGGTANVWFLIDEHGTVVKTQIARSSGHKALDLAALSVATTMEFHPARNRGDDVQAWVQVPITFSSK